MTIVAICLAVVCTAYIVSHADVKITINHTYPDVTPVSDDVLDDAYKDAEQNPTPDFINVIEAINKEFGGVDYGE